MKLNELSVNLLLFGATLTGLEIEYAVNKTESNNDCVRNMNCAKIDKNCVKQQNVEHNNNDKLSEIFLTPY